MTNPILLLLYYYYSTWRYDLVQRRSVGRGAAFVRDPPKEGIMSSSLNFNNIGPRLTCVVSVVWDASIIGGSWCSLT